MTGETGGKNQPFCLEEATIEDLHAAIRAGRTTCVEVVQHYIARARAYMRCGASEPSRCAIPRYWFRGMG